MHTEDAQQRRMTRIHKECHLRTQQIQYARSIFLTMAEGLVQTQESLFTPLSKRDTLHQLHPSTNEAVESRSFVRLLCHILRCQRISFLRIEPETTLLYPLVTVDLSSEQEQQWHLYIEGKHLRTLLNDSQAVARLLTKHVSLLDRSGLCWEDDTVPPYQLLAPIRIRNQLVGVLVVGYDQPAYIPSSHERELVKAIAALGAMIVEQERVQAERDAITAELQATMEQLERINTMKQTFLSVVSRELRTTLTGIQGFSEMMRDETFSMMEMKEFAADIYTDAKRLVRLVSDVLDENRMEARYGKLQLEWLDLNVIIREVVDDLRSLLSSHTLRLHLAPVLPILMGDREKLMQVIATVLNNAITYSPNGGEIGVTSVTEGNIVHISVEDHGIGIGFPAIDRIFEYYAHDASAVTMTPSTDGSGIGLPRVRQMLAIHGGEIWAESTPEEGSVFHITVPFVGGPLNERKG